MRDPIHRWNIPLARRYAGPWHFLFCAACLVCLAGGSLATAAEPEIRAGAARADITPEPAMLSWVTKKPWGGILDPIHARALVVGVGKDRFVIVTLDLVLLRESAGSKLRQAIGEAIGIPASHVLLNASHSHSAPVSPTYEPVWDSPLPRIDTVDNPAATRWKRLLPDRCVQAVREANAALRPVTLSIGRAYVGEWLFNRRPVSLDGRVKSTLVPADPYALPDGQKFGPVDPTATVLVFRDQESKSVATILNLACHAVSLYDKGLSADWPGPACENLQQMLGGEVLFAQGCAGDIVPARRGLKEAQDMGKFVAQRAAAAAAKAKILPISPLRISQAMIGLPLTPNAAALTGKPMLEVEIQVISFGDLAVVAIPGEPLTGIGAAIRDKSPFQQTLVLGYSNGRGVSYVDLPGEKEKGGYEMGPPDLGTDECGGLIVATALRLLRDHRAAPASAVGRISGP